MKTTLNELIKAIKGKLSSKGDLFFRMQASSGETIILKRKSPLNYKPTPNQLLRQDMLRTVSKRVHEELRDNREEWMQIYKDDPYGRRFNRLCDYLHSLFYREMIEHYRSETRM
ncbi:MAG: hypothetical protein IJ776_00560 [Paludibacteraceae bacterium]|nr:hypothetical protein [Paludibacteraceae bacterium]